jgi:hypothetical protein
MQKINPFIERIKSVVFFLIPNSKKWHPRFWRNPYYSLPVFFTFLIFLASPSISIFLHTYIIYISITLIHFTLTRTRRPFFMIEILLVFTEYFVGFKDARIFCGVLTFLICLIIPLFSCLISYFVINL